MRENESAVSAEERGKIETAIANLKDTLAKENSTKQEIEDKIKALTEVSHKLAEAMYAKTQQQGGNAAGGEQGKKPAQDDVIDAEVE
ncbi:hypothetical protein AGMMS49521_1750 [Campylobacterota bacterium]|nr:hypothetical protein AGMMS49521_1750 [Campylobacterota bacterium]